MTDLTPTPALTPVPQLEVNTLALGGTGNPMNLQAQALLNRDAYRAQQISDLSQAVADAASMLGSLSAEQVSWMLRTVADRFNDTANPKDYGAIADGASHPLSERYATLDEAQAVYPFATTLTDQIDWAACQASLNAGTPRWHIPGGHYVLNRDLNRTTSINIVQDGLMDFSSGTGVFRITGELTQIQDLGANVTRQSRTFTFASAPSLLAGDIFILYNPTDFSWSPHRSYYRAGEFFRAHSISGSVVRIYGLPSDPYVAADMDVYRMSPLVVNWESPNLIASASGASSPAAKITLATSVQMTAPRTSGGVYAGIEFERCYDMTIMGGSLVNNSPANGDDYGILVSNCQKWAVFGGGHQASRHAVALGGSSGPGCVPTRDFKVIGCTLETSGDDVGAADFHGNCDNGQYIDCTLDSHGSIGGRDPAYINCKFNPRSLADGSAVFGSEIVGGNYKFINCEMTTNGDLNSFGLINITCSALLKSDLKVIVRDLHVLGTGGGASAKLLRVSPFTGETLKVNTDVQGVRNELAQTLCVSWVRNDYNSALLVVSDGHIVDDVYGPAGMYLLYPTGAALTGIPSRQMMQSGSATVTTIAATSAPAAAQDIRYPFSKVPTSFSASLAGVGGANLDTVGVQNATARIKAMSATSITPALQANSAFTAGATALASWEAGIREI